MKGKQMASPDSSYERLGSKLLSPPDVIAQSVGFTGTVAFDPLVSLRPPRAG